MVNFVKFLKTWSLRSNSVTRHVSFNRTKIGGKCQNSKCDILSNVHAKMEFVLFLIFIHTVVEEVKFSTCAKRQQCVRRLLFGWTWRCAVIYEATMLSGFRICQIFTIICCIIPLCKGEVQCFNHNSKLLRLEQTNEKLSQGMNPKLMDIIIVHSYSLVVF